MADFRLYFWNSDKELSISDQHRWLVARIARFSSISPDSHRKMWIDEDFFRERLSNLRFPAKARKTCPDFQKSRFRPKPIGDTLKKCRGYRCERFTGETLFFCLPLRFRCRRRRLIRPPSRKIAFLQ